MTSPPASGMRLAHLGQPPVGGAQHVGHPLAARVERGAPRLRDGVLGHRLAEPGGDLVAGLGAPAHVAAVGEEDDGPHDAVGRARCRSRRCSRRRSGGCRRCPPRTRRTGSGWCRSGTGVPVSASRRVAGSNASRHASPQDLRVTGVVDLVEDDQRLALLARGCGAASGRTPTPAYVIATPWYSLLSGPALYSGSSLMPIRAAASAHCFFRCSVGATTVICCTTWWCSSQEARVSAKVVFPAPGVATARKSRGCSWMYASMPPAARRAACWPCPRGRGRGRRVRGGGRRW